MKKLIAIAAFMVSVLGASAADGTLDFNTGTSGNQVFDVNGTTPLSGSGAFGQVYWSATSNGTFSPAGTPVNFLSGGGAGFLSPAAGGAASDSITLPGTSPAQSVFVQVRAWKGAAGSFYESVGDTAKNSSSTFSVVLGGGSPPLPNNGLDGMNSFKLNPVNVPEPSTIALGLLGAGALLLRRRK